MINPVNSAVPIQHEPVTPKAPPPPAPLPEPQDVFTPSNRTADPDHDGDKH